MQTFGEFLRGLREARYLTQAELGEMAGLSRRGIQDLERGVRSTPHPTTIQRLADALGLDDAQRIALSAARQAGRAPTSVAAVADSREWPPTNLPQPLTSFVGRESDLARLLRLLDSTRILTLTGPGGVGKTRLALQVATRAMPTHPDGVWVVRLDALADAELVPAAVAAVLTTREQAGRSLTDVLVNRIGPERLLLVLDNCEHLIGACADLALALVRGCRQLRILATSREPLCLSGEVAWRVQPLAVPDAASNAVPDCESVRLFAERAVAAQPDFAVTPSNVEAVAEICRRLEGIPLALELAAARLPVLGVRGVVSHLDDRFRLLSGANRSGVARQQTLRDTLDWSYLLLTPPEQLLLQRLSVFAGGCTLEAAEAVCGEEPQVADAPRVGGRFPPTAVLELLSSLVAKSLVLAEPLADGSVRFRLLELVRAYARERLTDSRRVIETGRRHAEHFRAVAESTAPQLRGTGQVQALQQLERDHDNFRHALDYALEHTDASLGLRLAGALARFWYVRGYLEEGRSYLDRALALPVAPQDIAPRALALNGAGTIAWALGNFDTAETFLHASLELSRELGDARGIVNGLYDLSKVAVDQGDLEKSRRLAEEALAGARAIANTWSTAAILNLLGELRREQADLHGARTLYEQSLHLFRAADDERGQAVVTHNLAIVAAGLGDHAAAAELHRSILPLKRELGDREGIVCSLINLAHLGLLLGASEFAVRLCGAAENERARMRAVMPPYERTALAQTIELGRRTLGQPSFDTAWAAGTHLNLDAAIDLALAPGPRAGPDQHDVPHEPRNAATDTRQPVRTRVGK